MSVSQKQTLKLHLTYVSILLSQVLMFALLKCDNNSSYWVTTEHLPKDKKFHTKKIEAAVSN